MAPEVSVIVPTHNRREILRRTLERLAAQEGGAAFETIVVDDGSTDGTEEVARSFPIRTLSQENRGPAAARNRGIDAATAPVCLFIGDDTWPRPDLVARHASFHRARPEREDALLGRVAWAGEPSPFMRWLDEGGVQFEYHNIPEDGRLPGRFFYTSNVSAKTALLREAGGFDESFRHAACEDIDLGLRLEQAGMRLAYDPEALVDHHHPTDLPAALRRMRVVGRESARLGEQGPRPRRPDLRHRLKAGELTILNLTGLRPEWLRHETWRFLCHEAHREAYWGAEPPQGRALAIGDRLARIAARDPATHVTRE